MRPLKYSLILFLALFISGSISAETWDEPWQKEIIQNADYFVLARVLSNVDSIGAEIEIIKYFGSQKLEGKILINGFSLLHLGSTSGHGLHLNFKKGQVFYFLLTKREDGNYAIPTPTSGFAFLDDDKNVYATYRHSYHQALIPQSVYEQTYTEIWSYFKTSNFSKDNIFPFIDEYINMEPAGFEEQEISTFFLQHTAMETAYLLDIPITLDRITKFIEFENFHSRVSALRLLSNSNEERTKIYLFEFIRSEQHENFEKVIAIWSLDRIGGEEYKDKMLAIADDLSDEETGFGGNIMDPRVGTYFPSPKGAVEALKLN